MELIFRGNNGTCVCDWESFALLRDNVQHFLERGEPSARFEALHSIEDVVQGRARNIDAARLRGEVLRAWCALWQVPLADAAISLRTRAILTGVEEPPAARGTVAARIAGWSLPVVGAADDPVPRGAARFVEAVLKLTATSVDGDSLQVKRTAEQPATQGSWS